MIRRFLCWLLGPPRRGQTTWVWCPVCHDELTRNGIVLSDDARGVFYRCAKCAGVSLWDFGAPAPLLRWHDAQVRP